MTIRINGKWNFQPRDYQLPFLEAMDSGIRNAVLVFHRRAGKTLLLLNWAIAQMVKNPGIAILHAFPTYAEGKKIVFDNQKFLNYFPQCLLAKIPNKQDLLINFKNGSTYRVVGTDDPNKLRGIDANICILDEYSYQNPLAYSEVLEPIILANKGVVIYCGTPCGKNHLYEKFNDNQFNDHWFVQKLTIDDTHREDGTPIITKEEVDQKRKEGTFEATIQAEYYCSFEGSVTTSYYIRQLTQAREDGRIGIFNHITTSPVYTTWDIGFNDSTAIWFIQKIGGQYRIIDYYENKQESFDHYAKIVKNKPYNYMTHYFPHDIAHHEQTHGKTKKAYMEELGVKPIETVPRALNRAEVMVGIESVRGILSNCVFNEKTCSEGLSRLSGYHAGYNEKREVLLDSPVHDKNSNGADAFRCFAVSKLGKMEENEEHPYVRPVLKRQREI